jgi:hypothetical protein
VTGSAPPDEPAQPPEIDRDLRRRLDEVFGEVLPRVPSDEREPGERSGMDPEFYRSNRPPHHDR